MTIIFVPTRFKERVAAMPEVMHVWEDEMSGEYLTIPMRGYFMDIKPSVDVWELFGFSNCYSGFTSLCRAGAILVVPFTTDERDDFAKAVHVLLDEQVDISTFAEAHTYVDLVKFIRPIVMSLGCEVTLHLSNAPAFEPFYNENHIHIVLSSRAPGSAQGQSINMLENVLLTSTTAGAKCPGPTAGRGRTVMYDEDFCIGQIIGSTLYLFLPFGKKAEAPYANAHDNPFRIALACVWTDYIDKSSNFEEAAIDTYSEFALRETSESLHSMMRKQQEETVVRLQKAADKLRTNLAVVHTELKVQIAILSALEKGPLEIDLEPLWDELKSHPHIKSISVADDSHIHYHTNPVLIEDEAGVLRDVGSFTIRVSDFDVHVWSNRLTHPKRISHPHISSADNSICFGNVSSEIAKLCAENRRIEAALLTLRWLFEGYEPSLTHHRVEEWPEAELETTKELLCA